jgi:hypothetical protein
MRGLLAAAVLFATVLSAQTITFKAGRYRFGAEKLKKYDRGFDFAEVEASTPHFAHGRLDMAFQFGGVTMESRGEVTVVGDHSISSEPAFKRQLWQFTASPRFFPAGDRAIAPYVSGGLGYYRYFTHSTFAGRPVACPGGWSGECYERESSSHTLASGLGKFVGAGLYIPFTPRVRGEGRRLGGALSAEYRYHFLQLNKAAGLDLGGSQLLFGIGLRWR